MITINRTLLNKINSKKTSLCNNNYKLSQKRNFVDPTVVITSASVIGGAIVFGSFRYKVSNPNQYLVRTGLGIKDIKISKQGFQWPFQKYKFISMEPHNYTFNLSSMSLEKLEFVLPGVFTIGPKDNIESITKYVRVLENSLILIYLYILIIYFFFPNFYFFI